MACSKAFTRRRTSALQLPPLPALLLLTSAIVSWVQVGDCVPRLFVIGDSHEDVGNLVYARRKWTAGYRVPYGMTTRKATGRYSDGKLFCDYLAETMGIPYPPPALAPRANFSFGFNMACAGATGYFNNYSSTPFNAEEQYAFLELQVKIGLKPTMEDIVIFMIGTNDILRWIKENPMFFMQFSRQIEVAAAIVERQTYWIQKIYNLGFRNLIVSNLPPIGCTPMIRATFGLGKGCFSPATKLVNHVNFLMESDLDAFRKTARGANVLMLDLNNAFQQTARVSGIDLAGPACCGWPKPTNGLVQCGQPLTTICDNPARSAFWDTTHPTQTIYQGTFRQAWSGDQRFIRPYNLQALFSRIRIKSYPLRMELTTAAPLGKI